jgi:hypothetical protein
MLPLAHVFRHFSWHHERHERSVRRAFGRRRRGQTSNHSARPSRARPSRARASHHPSPRGTSPPRCVEHAPFFEYSAVTSTSSRPAPCPSGAGFHLSPDWETPCGVSRRIRVVSRRICPAFPLAFADERVPLFPKMVAGLKIERKSHTCPFSKTNTCPFFLIICSMEVGLPRPARRFIPRRRD